MAVTLNITGHPWMLGDRLPVYATMNGLVGGGWEPSCALKTWFDQQGAKGRISIGICVPKDRPITFADYGSQNAEVIFTDPDDAFFFKMAWL